MKLKSFIAVILAALLLSSCGSLSKLAGSTDFTNGSSAGSVISKLFNEFIGSGSIDFNKAQNILNLVTLANSITSLKGDVSNQTTQDFTKGLIQGSQNLVNNTNSSGVMDLLSSLSNMNMSGAAASLEKGNTASNANVSGIVSGLNGIMSLLKK